MPPRSPRLCVLLVLAGALVLGVLSMPGTATAAKRPPQDFFSMDIGARPDQTDFEGMRSAKVASVRFPVSWRGAQPTAGAPFRWTAIDRLVGGAASQGIAALPTVVDTPGWVESKGSRAPVAGKGKQDAWTSFLTALVNRYKPGGEYWKDGPVPLLLRSPYHQQFGRTAPVEPVHSWQIWNEPSLEKFFSPHKNAATKYAQLVKISHQAIKDADPQADVVLAGLTGFASPRSWDFLKQLYHVKGFKRSFEVAALHPYAPTIHELSQVVSRVRKTMRKAHDKKTPLWLTEHGYGSRKPMKKWPLNKGLQGQAKTLTKTYKLLIQKRKKWHIERVYWYNWRDPPEGENRGTCSFCTSSGLLKNNRKPKPAYHAFVHLSGGH
jgi:hypothetical protein